jgi:L-histidine N-alpha-methyltransferase
LEAFRHRAFYSDERSRVEIQLVSKKRQEVSIDALDLSARFEEGEPIHTESAYKFDHASIDQLARATGFDVSGSWTDGQRRFADFLLAAR